MNLSKVTKMAVLSGNAYKYTDINKLPPRSTKRYERLSHRVLVYTEAEEQHQTIVVRGSMLLKRPCDILMNININPVHYNDYDVHRGFFNEAVKIRTLLKDKNVINSNYRVNLTGHSSGGCIACILAMLLQEEMDNVTDVITFGQPKFIKYAYECPLSCTRIVNIADPIPILPIWDYKHMGTPLILDEYNQGNVPRLYDHEMRCYINNLVLNFMRPI
jgi:predicted lipase